MSSTVTQDHAGAPTQRPANRINMERLPLIFESDDRRVITRPFISGGQQRVASLFERMERLSDEQVEQCLEAVCEDYGKRHRDIRAVFAEHFHLSQALLNWSNGWSRNRQLLAGSYLTMEYAIDAAALFNPSIVAHPNQKGVAPGAVRIIMSLRATGEGHISSVVFRTGTINADHSIHMDPPPRFMHRARIAPDRHYVKPVFGKKLREMAVTDAAVDSVLGLLNEKFTLVQLTDAAEHLRLQGLSPTAQQAMDAVLWLARSNYHIDLAPDADIAETVIFPLSAEEGNGVEDLRLVRFVDDDGSVTYFGTYTAYDGRRILPMLISTHDFHRIDIHSLNGACAKNKGMGLFPRRIGGHYVMCSRIDGESLYIMYSDYVHFWESAEKLVAPTHPWELMHIGNCGSPMETQEGWLLLTHGVGPMRAYSIGAMLLDRDDPLKVRGHLAEPFLTAEGEEREGYVPNVVYTCGAMIHNDRLYLPYAMADTSATVAVVNLDDLLNRLLDSKRS